MPRLAELLLIIVITVLYPASEGSDSTHNLYLQEASMNSLVVEVSPGVNSLEVNSFLVNSFSMIQWQTWLCSMARLWQVKAKTLYIKMWVPYVPLRLSTLGKFFSRQQFEIFFLSLVQFLALFTKLESLLPQGKGKKLFCYFLYDEQHGLQCFLRKFGK